MRIEENGYTWRLPLPRLQLRHVGAHHGLVGIPPLPIPAEEAGIEAVSCFQVGVEIPPVVMDEGVECGAEGGS